VSGPVRHRRPWRRLARRSVPVALACALIATLAMALQVREVRVAGTRRFPASQVEATLRAALGTPTIAVRADQMRTIVRRIPWVADATVRVSLDGVVSCTVSERMPTAVARDGATAALVDAEGQILGPSEAGAGLLEIDGFASFPEERAALLAAVPALEHGWGDRLQRAERIGPCDVALHFAASGPTLIADPAEPAALGVARRVLAAWVAANKLAPQRLDVRVVGRVAVLPAPPAAAAETS
jgi:hypothetical protein